VVSTLRKWIPLVSVGLAYLGFAAGLGVISLIGTPEYEHATDLHLGIVTLAWSLVAIASVAVSTISLLLVSNQVGRSLRWITVALNVPVVIALGWSLQLSISNLQDYTAGFAAYETAVHVCGNRPVLAGAGWGGDILLPGDPDYERLKYSTRDHLLLGTPTYFCTLADAEAHGYQRAPRYSPPP